MRAKTSRFEVLAQPQNSTQCLMHFNLFIQKFNYIVLMLKRCRVYLLKLKDIMPKYLSK